MDDHEVPGPRALAGIVGGLVLLVCLVAVVFMGGQTSRILSNVGAAVGDGCCEPGVAPVDTGGSPAGEPVDEGKVADAAARPPELLVIRTGRLVVEVADLTAAVAAADERIAALGGYVGASEENAAGDESSASIIYRVPANRWSEATSGIRSLAERVVHATSATEEVTGQVIDLDARVRNLRATEASFQSIMVQATRIDDVLAVQDQLTHVREEIERLVAQKEALEERAAFGTLTVVFELPAPPAVEVVQRGWDPAADVDRSVGTLVKIVQRGVSFAIWAAIVALPVLVGIGAAAIVAWQAGRLVQRVRRRPEAV